MYINHVNLEKRHGIESGIFLTIKNQKKKTGHLSGLYTLGTSSALVAFSGKLVVSYVLLNHLNPYTPCVY